MGGFSRKARAMAGALALAATQSAQASFIVDFRFSSNPADTTRTVTSSGDVPVEVWGTVLASGTLGIGVSYFRAQSQQLSGGAFTSAGVAGGFAPIPGVFDNVSVAGTASDINADGLTDLGVLSGIINPSDAKARAYPAPDPPGTAPGYYNTPTSSGWVTVTGGSSIKLGTFTIHVGTLGTGTTKFNVAIPSGSSAAIWYENATTLNGSSITGGGKFPGNGTYSAGTSVTFLAPEPPILRYALTTHNDATLGTANTKSLSVTGSNKNYADPGAASNYQPANGTSADYAIANANLGVGGELPVLVMLDFNLGISGLTITQLEADLLDVGDVGATLIGPADPDPLGQRALLLSQYPSFNPLNSLLFEFLSAPGAVSSGLHFGFDFTGSGVSVVQAIAVPEPASAGLLGLGSLGLLRRSRRR